MTTAAQNIQKFKVHWKHPPGCGQISRTDNRLKKQMTEKVTPSHILAKTKRTQYSQETWRRFGSVHLAEGFIIFKLEFNEIARL